MSNIFSLTGPLELWGGVECTYNRVGDSYFDQMRFSGHATRVSDLDLFATLGLSALRYPVLWEHFEPQPETVIDWSWADERLGRLRELNLRPIVGLVHHGSGPRHTNLLDDNFALGLASFARRVAERFPWITDYAPVNEPLTTARFSGLYGYWHPHGRDNAAFARILLNQCRAVVLVMREIRGVNPAARLVQTEDLGVISSTPHLAYQADFENERRWLTFDLLCGRVDRAHPMWHFLRYAGISEADIEWFAANPYPPDVIGIDHYLTSNRHLDERLDLYPPHTHGGNGHDAYADVETVRVPHQPYHGPDELLRATWERYHLPVALTEAHLGCTREEQLRWLQDVWQAARLVRAEGIPVRAVTSWALLGAYNWNTVVTSEGDHYEPGAFDTRAPQPRPTAVAGLLRNLGTQGQSPHPVLPQAGWWRRSDRALYPPAPRLSYQLRLGARSAQRRQKGRPLLITGAPNPLAQACAHICDERGLPYYLLTDHDIGITDAVAIDEVFGVTQPWALVNTADYGDVEQAEYESPRCFAVNSDGAVLLARACAKHDARLLGFSSDLVFDGTLDRPYLESDVASPLSVYGQSKAEMEHKVLCELPGALIARSGPLFGPWDNTNIVTRAMQSLARGESFAVSDESCFSPTYVTDLAHAALDLLIDGESGIWHLANRGAATWFDLLRQTAALADLDAGLIEEQPSQNPGDWMTGHRVLDSERGWIMPVLDDALARYVAARPWQYVEELQSTLVAV